MQKTRTILKNNFPEKIVVGAATNWSARVVPRSSSETNARERPDIAEKKITTQNSPAVKLCVIVSFPTENKMTLIATITNIANEFTAYLVLISE